MAITPVFCCGFECGQSTGGAHWGSPSSGGSYSTTNPRNGARAFRCAAAGGQAALTSQFALSSQTLVFRVAVYFTSLPAVDVALAVEGNSQEGAWFKAADSKIYAGHSGAATGATGVAVTTGQWYVLDVKIKRDANPHLTDVQVNGTACGQDSNASAAGVTTSVVLGNINAAATFTADFDDFIASVTLADYPIGDGYVNHFVPTSDGTHTATGSDITEGTIATPVGTAITSATTDAFNWVNGVPLLGGATDNTRLINQQKPASTEYAEVVFGPAPGISTPTTAPRAVEVITADRQAATQAGNMTVKINDNGTEAVVVSRSGNGVTSDRFATAQFATAPTGGAWTVAAGAGNFNNLRARFGYSSDATPDQFWRGIMIEAEFVAAASGATTAQALTATAVTSTATMQRQTNKAVTATATTSTATFQKQVNKPLTSTAAGSTATVQKQVNKAMTATAVTSTATLAALKVIVRTLTATAVTSTATMTRQVNKLLTATAATSTATMVRSVAKTLTATAITSTASVQKQVNKAMTAAAVVATATLAAPRLLSVTLTAAAVTSTATLAAVFQAAAGTVTALFMGIFGHSNPPQGSENEDL